MAEVISLTSLCTFIQTVKLDHIMWKVEVYRTIRGESKKTAEDFADHHQCRLGKWYYEGEGRAYYASLLPFKALEAPHASVHEAGKHALEAYRNEDKDKLVSYLNQMESASVGVFDCLNDLEKMVRDQGLLI